MSLRILFARALAVGALGSMTLLASCAESLRHSDTISEHAGEFMSADLLAEEIDPWPAVGFEKRQPLDGQKAMEITKAYRHGSGLAPGAASAPVPTSSTGTGSTQ